MVQLPSHHSNPWNAEYTIALVNTWTVVFMALAHKNHRYFGELETWNTDVARRAARVMGGDSGSGSNMKVVRELSKGETMVAERKMWLM